SQGFLSCASCLRSQGGLDDLPVSMCFEMHQSPVRTFYLGRNTMSIRYRASAGAMRWRPTALAIAMGLSFSGAALAQSTVGSIFGQAPAASGETVMVSNTSGFSREVPVDSAGRYRVDHLPVGTYTVTLK